MKQKLTPGFVASVPVPERDRVFFWDTVLPGFGLQVMASGKKSFVAQYRHAGRPYRMAIKGGHALTLGDARKEAKALLGVVAKGGNPLQERRKAEMAGADSFKSICEEYLAREEKAARLRSLGQRRAILERLVYDKLGKLPISEIRRSDVTRLLDRIEDERGAAMAHITLATIRRVMNWHAMRDDDFVVPLVRGMGRRRPGEHAGERVLNDAEIRALWITSERLGTPFARMLQLLLLTATRRDEARCLRRDEIFEGIWLIPAERHKSKRPVSIPLSPAAKTVIAAVPVIGPAGGYVFSHDGERAIGGMTHLKAAFDRASGVTGWKIHDLRRTARTLLSRAGVNADIGELCSGRAIPGVRGVYDRHSYEDEKRLAFEKLAALVERLVNPPADNVVALQATAGER